MAHDMLCAVKKLLLPLALPISCQVGPPVFITDRRRCKTSGYKTSHIWTNSMNIMFSVSSSVHTESGAARTSPRFCCNTLNHACRSMPQMAATCRTNEQPMEHRPSATWSTLQRHENDVITSLLLAAHTSLSPFYIALCLLCSVDIFIAYAMSFFCFSIFMINNDLYSVMIILWLVCVTMSLVPFVFLYLS